MAFRRMSFTAALILSSACTAQSAWAQDKALSIELNTAADRNDGCRLSFVATNETGQLLDQVSYEVFTFDDKGGVGQSLVFQFGRFPAEKTKVVQFDLPGSKCAAISRLLVNDVTECVAAGKSSTICIDALTTTTRSAIAFGK